MNNHTTTLGRIDVRRFRALLGAAGVQLFMLPERVLHTLYAWQGRIDTRARLADLDDHLLAAVGLDRDAVTREMSKPFWRA